MLNQIRIIFSVIIIVVLLPVSGLLFGVQSAAAADGEELDLSRIELPEKGNPKLDSRLNQLVSANITAKAASFAQEHNIEMVDDNVRVIIECLPDQIEAATNVADDLGIVESSYRNLLQVVVPVSQLTTLADSRDIRLVRLPWELVATANISEGVALINADDWHTASYNGTGVKVGILDGGFSGYTTRQSEGELPSTVTTWWAPSIGGPGTSVHGTACAEIVYDIAPDADFYLANFVTIVEQSNAVDWLITQGVDVISCSVAWTVGGPGDGTGTACEIVDDAHTAGILWSQSAGNEAERHWQGDFSDGDTDGWHNFSVIDETIDISVNNGETITVELKWDDTWGSSGNDYDLYLGDSSLTNVASSIYPQDGDDDPWEYISYTATYTGTYHIVIDGYYASQTANLEIFCYNHDLQEYQVASHSLSIPADSGNATSVGAVDYSTPTTLESFSSQGPTTDNRIKPDLVAPDGVSTATYGTTNFYGTSASAPHVAGAAVLVKERYPSYTPAQIQSFLEGRAVDLGDSGKDNLFGSGRLDLGSPPEAVPPTMEAIVEAEGGYYNTAPVLSNFGFDDNEALDDGWYQMDSYTGTWLTLFTDNGTASWDNDGWTIPGFDGLSEGSHTIYFKASDEADNVEGESGEWNWQFYKDTTPPTMEAITETEGQYYNVAPVLSNFGFDDNEALDDGSYQMDSFAGAWTALFTGVFVADVSDLVVASDNTTIYATDRQRDKFYRSTDAGVSWTELTNPTGATEPQLIAVTPDDADFVAIVADDNEVYISDDAFTTWDTLDLELADATITVQDLDISVAFDGNHYVAVVGDNGTDAKVYYYEIEAIGSMWELISDKAGFAEDQDEAGAVVLSPNFASDEVMVTVTANLSDTINFQVFSFNTEKWNEDAAFVDYPVTITSDDGITGLDSASISLAPDYLGSDNTTRISFVSLTIAGDADAVATSGIYCLKDVNLTALKAGEQIHSIAYNGTNLVAGEYDTTVVWRSTDPLAATPTVSSSLSSPGGDDKVVVAWAGSDVVAGTSGNESAFAVSTDNGENFTDISLDGTSWDSDNWTIPGFGALSEDSHTIYFSASDNASNVEGESGEWSWQFFATDLPVLRDGAVSPTSGDTSATFTYSVTYADAEDDPPNPITVSIDGGASENMTVKAGQDDDFTNGEIYEYSISGSNLGVGTHTFQFAASDGTDNATGDISLHDGPTVSSPPKVGGGGGGGGGGGLPGVTSVAGEHNAKGKFEYDVTCKSEDKCVELFIPEGAIGKGPNDTFLRVIKIFEAEVLPPIPEHTNYIGLVYNFHYEGTTFNPPVDLTIRYDESLIPEGIDENSLIIATWDKYASEWIELESTVDTEKKMVTTKIDHFTKFTILAHTRPANFTVTNLSVTPKEVDIGESVSISILITNTGDLAGSYEVKLKIDDVVTQTKEVTLDGGDSETVSFSVTSETVGERTVNVNGLLRTFEVQAPEAPPVPAVAPAPARFAISDLSVTPSEVKPAEQVTISAVVTNTGGSKGSYTIVLKINDVEEVRKNVTLGASKSETVTFTVANGAEGSYAVEIDGNVGQFTVTLPPTNWWLIGGIIAAGIVAAGLLVYFFVWPKRGALVAILSITRRRRGS